MKLRKIITSVISILICITVLIQTVSASAQTQTLYVKDLKIIYADSAGEASKQLPDGYTLVKGNINADTGRTGVYLCYSTTTDESKALTDIKVMNESGGFERTDFQSSLDTAVDGIYSLADEMTIAVTEFAQNFKDGVPAAVYAKEALDYFLFDESTPLGEFMISGKGTYEDYGRMILMCHEDILNPILSLLTLGVQKKQGENWIDKLADVDPSAYNSSHDLQYRERATKIRPILQQFNDIYCYVLGYYGTTYTYDDLTAENDKELFTQMAENKDLFKILQTILESYPVGVDSSWGEWGGTAADIFSIGLNTSLNIYESYALLDCLTPGQEIMLRLSGPYSFIIGSQNTEEVLAEARNRIVAQLDKDEKVMIWEGINLDLFDHEVGLTSDAQRSIAAGKQYDIFTKDIDILQSRARDIASIVSSSFTIASSAVLVAKCALIIAPKFFNWLGAFSVANAISAFGSATLVTSLLTGFGIGFVVAGIVCAIIVTFFLEDIINSIFGEDYERTTIPLYMVDEALTKDGVSTYAYYKRVDNVKSDKELDLDTGDNECGADINANKGYRWMAIYTSDKSSLGNPIKADLLVVEDSGLSKEGYVPLTDFGKIDATNLNSYADKNSSKFTSVYLFYSQDANAPVESEKMYISDIRVETAEHEDVAKKELTDSGFIVINHNFGCKQDEATFIGYKLTANPHDAVRDIRLLYNFDDSGITYGDLCYGSMGSIGNFDVMVSSSSSNPAPPVVSLAIFKRDDIPDASLGYEPVNEFAGGMAQPLGSSDYRIYFLPEKTFTEGPDYIAGIKTDVYYFNTYTEIYGYEYTKRYYYRTDKYGNNTSNYRNHKLEKYGEQFFDFESSTSYYFQGKDNGDSHNTYVLGYKYTTTKNPYRAMYSVTATTRSGLDAFNDSVSYGGDGYVLSPVELSTNSCFYSDDNFIYAARKNKNEFGKRYNVYRSGYVDDIDFYSSEYSSGKADATVDTKTYFATQGVHSRTDIANQDITQVFFSKNMNALYISGYQADRTPLTVNDIIITKNNSEDIDIPDNFTPVCSMIGSSSQPANISPTNDEVVAGYYSTYGGMSKKAIKVTLYGDKINMYFRNEKTVNGKVQAQPNPKEGKYISGVFITSREEIRESALKNNNDIKCKNISKSIVENALLGEGATITYNKHINTNFDKDDDFANANYTYVGITRTDDPNNAIRDIKLFIAQKGESPKKIIKVPVTYNGKTFDVSYSLVSKASLTEQGNKSDKNCAKERQVYVYISSHPALGDPITDIKMSNWFSYEDFEPVLTTDNKHFITAYNDNKKADGASIFVDSDYFMHGNHLSFKRENGDLPYVQSIMIAAHDDGSKQAITKLLNAGYTDIVKKELNEDAGGDYIYLGMKRTADVEDSVFDLLLTNNKKKPPDSVNGYTLVSKIDLNKDAGGKYIYLYEKRTADVPKSERHHFFYGERTPLLDLKTRGKSFENLITTKDNTYCYESLTCDVNGNKIDLNQGAGGDYIYLTKIFEETVSPTLSGALLGPGSIGAISFFAAAALAAAGFIIYKKRRRSNNEKNS